jgi:hypothetical protein
MRSSLTSEAQMQKWIILSIGMCKSKPGYMLTIINTNWGWHGTIKSLVHVGQRQCVIYFTAVTEYLLLILKHLYSKTSLNGRGCELGVCYTEVAENGPSGSCDNAALSLSSISCLLRVASSRRSHLFFFSSSAVEMHKIRPMFLRRLKPQFSTKLAFIRIRQPLPCPWVSESFNHKLELYLDLNSRKLLLQCKFNLHPYLTLIKALYTNSVARNTRN